MQTILYIFVFFIMFAHYIHLICFAKKYKIGREECTVVFNNPPRVPSTTVARKIVSDD